MAWAISKLFRFSAAHHLLRVPEDHPCGRQHGHNYTVAFTLSSTELAPDGVGWVQDYGDLHPIRFWIDQKLDHQDLNEVFREELENGALINTTAECLSHYLYNRWKGQFPLLLAVDVQETETVHCTYIPSSGESHETKSTCG